MSESDRSDSQERPKRARDRDTSARRDDRPPPRSGGGGGGYSRDSNLCYKWPQGTCTYGDNCRFVHEGPGGTTGGGGGGRGGRGGRGGSSGRGGGTELFLRGIDYYMTKEDIRDEILTETRGVAEIILPLNRESDDQNRGFAILKFETEGDARDAMSKLNGMECRGRGLFARWSEENGGGGGGGGFDRRPRYDRGYGGGGGRSNECFRWAREGTCSYGNDCRFEHSGGPRGRSSDRGGGGRGWRGGGGSGRRDICYAYERDGNCSYGNSCRFVHE